MKYFLLLLLFGSRNSFAQQMIEGTVIDSNCNPLQYVSIGIIGTAYGTVSNLQGHFRFSFQNTNPLDSIRFSMVGFGSKIFSVGDFIGKHSDGTVILHQDPVPLKEVEVHPEATETKIVGNQNIHSHLTVNFSIAGQLNQNLGSEVGRKFRISKPTTIQKVNFYLSANDYDTATFRINIYSIHHGQPSQNIVREDIIRQVCDKEKNWIEVDLGNKEITVSKDVVVAVEWIGGSFEGTLLSMPITFPSIGAVHFYKFGSQNKWKIFSNMSSSITLQVAD